MISDGRYHYHLDDIAEIKRMPHPLDPVVQLRLRLMQKEVAEYERAHGIPSSQNGPSTERIRTEVFVQSALPAGQACKHGRLGFCGFCDTGTDPSYMKKAST